MKPLNCSFLVLSFAIALSGCGRAKIDRVEWPVMGTIAAVQVRSASMFFDAAATNLVRQIVSDLECALNAHDPNSELSRLAPLEEEEILSRCGKSPMWYRREVRPCYEAAFKLMHESGGAFNPRWRGPKTLDLGAIAKGFVVDVAAQECYCDGADALIDIGGNIKAVRGSGGSHRPWRTGVMDPGGGGFAAVVDLCEGEALATSATYYRGSHIYDGRTGLAVSNGVASVTVLCSSAMWADGLSTTLFILGPDEGRAFVEEKGERLTGGGKIAVLWILSDGRQVKLDPDSRFSAR